MDLKELNIAKKITLLTLLIAFISVGSNSLIGIYYDIKNIKKGLINEVTVIASILSRQCTTSLLFDDQSDAEQNLNSLVKDQCITNAVVYGPDGREFAAYVNDSVGNYIFRKELSEASYFTKDHFIVSLPIKDDNEKIGSIMIASSLKKLDDQIAETINIAIISIISVILVASLLIHFLQRNISQPIIKFTDTVKRNIGQVPEKVNIESEDEIGFLAAAYNRMIDSLSETTVSKEYVENIIASIVDMLIVIDDNGIIKEINKSVTDQLGYKETDIVGKPFGFVLAEEEFSFGGKEFEKMVGDGSIKDHDLTFQSKEGKGIQFSVNSSVMRDRNGKFIGIVLIARDLREVQDLMLQIDYAKTFSETVVSTIPSGVMVLDKNLKVLSANPGAKSIISKLAKSSCIESGALLKDYFYQKQLTTVLKKVVKNQKPFYDFEVRFGEEDFENPQILNLTAVPLKFDEEDRIKFRLAQQKTKNAQHYKPSVLLLIEDVTEKKKLTSDLRKSLAELHETQSQLIESNKMASLGAMSAGIAHELSQPLGAILLKTQLVPRLIDKGESEKVKLINESMKNQTLRAKKIMDSLRIFSRDGKNVEREKCDVNHLVDDVLTMFLDEFKLLKVNLELRLHEEKTAILVSSVQVGQVLANLLSNARDAVENSNPKNIIISTFLVRDTIVIEISDNGCGISEKSKEKIFEPFYTTKKVGKGTGLGLSMSYSMIKENGGEIKVISEEGRGTKFQLIFPAIKELCYG